MTNADGTMTAEFLRFNLWANLRLIDACLTLSEEQLASGGTGVFGTIYATFQHIVRSEASYYRRLTGVRLEPPFAWEANPPLSQIRSYADQVGSAIIEAAERMQMSDTLPRDWQDPDWESFSPRYKALGMLIQAVSHGIEHRTNITTTLAQLGIETPDLAGWEYILRNPERMGGS